MPAQADTKVVSDPGKLRVVADPVRLALLQEFASPKTIAAAAENIGFVGKGIYRHVDKLLQEGFLTVVSTARKRGTIERTLQASAKRFVAIVGEQPTPVRIEPQDLEDLRQAIDDLVREYRADSPTAVPVQVSLDPLPRA